MAREGLRELSEALERCVDDLHRVREYHRVTSVHWPYRHVVHSYTCRYAPL